jgi:crossover junction endodeoxyribonuclease RuvC
LSFVACGLVQTKGSEALWTRLARLDAGLAEAIALWRPEVAAVEETFMNSNAASALKLGQARGVAVLAPARFGIEVFEYATNKVKKTVVGTGHAAKDQIGLMIRTLLPKSGRVGEDEGDALAVAICHAHHAPGVKFLRTN